MLYTVRHHNELAFFDPLLALTKLHEQAALDHKKQLVLVVMMMPDEFALQLRQLYVHIINVCHQLRRPELAETPEFFGDVDP